MSLSNCIDCKKEISDLAPVCIHCGLPNSEFVKNKKQKIKKPFFRAIVIILCLLLFMFILLIFSVGLKDRPVSVDPEKVMHVNMSQLTSEYEANEIGADEKYNNKIIQVTDVIRDIDTDLIGTPVIYVGKIRLFGVSGIRAMFDDSMGSQIGLLRRGDKITLVCTMTGLLLGEINGKDCIIK
ncbi:hypothetical protein JI57_04610 [Psychromonas sp. PRT-SC03]|nr:hypothetical protein JI57_04610 [Psychromonas sp. PRT-SC03]